MREIEIKELVLVGGGFGVPGAIAGGVTGGASYVGYQTINGQGNMGGFIVAVAGGAIGGFFTGPAALTGVAGGALGAVGGSQIGFYGGMATGIAEKALDATGVNYSGTNYN